jgi:hypothetical protein
MLSQLLVTATETPHRYTPPVTRDSLIRPAGLSRKKIIHQRGNAMDVLWEVLVFVGHAIEQALVYVETHHWIFGFLAAAYIFYLHDQGLHARFDTLEKRIDEIRKRLSIEY